MRFNIIVALARVSRKQLCRGRTRVPNGSGFLRFSLQTSRELSPLGGFARLLNKETEANGREIALPYVSRRITSTQCHVINFAKARCPMSISLDFRNKEQTSRLWPPFAAKPIPNRFPYQISIPGESSFRCYPITLVRLFRALIAHSGESLLPRRLPR